MIPVASLTMHDERSDLASSLLTEDRFSLSRNAFGADFKWGVSTAAFQVEGAWNVEGKGPSIWDEFTRRNGTIRSGHLADTSCDFYHRYAEDIDIIKFLSIDHFRFSISWSRILPAGTGKINAAGVDFYNRVIDRCLRLGIEPWITLYHWDLPLELKKKGGWANRDILGWFTEYTSLCVKLFGDRVKRWIIMNEPLAFTGAGYFLGIHAPGHKGLGNFLPAVHHATICQLSSGRMVKDVLPGAEVGTSFSCSMITPVNDQPRNVRAAARMDALLNRMSVEPLLGMGYPVDQLPSLRKIEKYFHPSDEKLYGFRFDFIGLQNYTREVVMHVPWVPYVHASIVKAGRRNVPVTSMDWEIYPPSIFEMLKRFSAYPGVNKIYVTENGASFPDKVENGHVHDQERMRYFSLYLSQVLRAKNEGVNVQGYFAWTLLDNFEWAEGYHQRFGLVYVDFETRQRIIKDSAFWYKAFLEK